ncbi:MAG TPA: DUF3566 domain-containing protein [Acidimicrobiales bacterium]|nr:DUF3566 domain-containing protein [Acidimicrobiales bacterium]
MPDEPTSGAGDGGSSSPRFRGGVERAETTSDVPPRPVAPTSGSAATTVNGGRDTGAPAPSGLPYASDAGDTKQAAADGRAAEKRRGKVRARKVRRIVRHIEPWSVLKISVLFFAVLFGIICVASAVLWAGARSTGTVDDIESFITDVGGFGTCEPIDGAATDTSTTTTVPVDPNAPVDQFDPTGTETTVAPGAVVAPPPDDGEECREGEKLVGEFKFEDGRIFQAFLLGGIVLVLAGAATAVVLVLLFNLISDLTGGVRVTVLEEDPPVRSGATGSPRPRPRD